MHPRPTLISPLYNHTPVNGSWLTIKLSTHRPINPSTHRIIKSTHQNYYVLITLLYLAPCPCLPPGLSTRLFLTRFTPDSPPAFYRVKAFAAVGNFTGLVTKHHTGSVKLSCMFATLVWTPLLSLLCGLPCSLELSLM